MRAKVRDTEIYFDVDGMKLVADGDKLVERPSLFLLHGGPGSDHTGLASNHVPLRDVAQLVYLDHRGCGRSSTGDPQTYTLENNIEDLDALREHVGLERIAILGTSYGGMVAQGYAIRYPHRVSNLILVVTAPSYRFLDDAKRILQERGTPEQIEVAQRLWAGSFESTAQLKDYYLTMGPLYWLTWDAEEAEKSWERASHSYLALNRGFSDFLRSFDFIDQLHNICCPTLVIAGEHDWICPPNHSRLIAEKIPRAQLKIFANSAHAVPADEADKYLAAIRGFLTYAPV